MESAGRVFMIDNGSSIGSHYQHMLEEHGYEVFATNNAYKLIKYAKELHPQLYVVDTDAADVDAWQVLNYLSGNHYLDEAPAIMLNTENKNSVIKGAAHYVSRQESEKLLEIVDAYCKGGGGYNVLLLEDYLPISEDEFSGMDGFQISYFKVYDAHSAKMFLQRNAPQAVVVHCHKEDYETIKNMLGYENVFYIENRSNMQKLVSFLK